MSRSLMCETSDAAGHRGGSANIPVRTALKVATTTPVSAAPATALTVAVPPHDIPSFGPRWGEEWEVVLRSQMAEMMHMRRACDRS